MASYALALFVVAAFLALIAVALSDPSERRLAAGVGVVASALFLDSSPRNALVDRGTVFFHRLRNRSIDRRDVGAYSRSCAKTSTRINAAHRP